MDTGISWIRRNTADCRFWLPLDHQPAHQYTQPPLCQNAQNIEMECNNQNSMNLTGYQSANQSYFLTGDHHQPKPRHADTKMLVSTTKIQISGKGNKISESKFTRYEHLDIQIQEESSQVSTRSRLSIFTNMWCPFQMPHTGTLTMRWFQSKQTRKHPQEFKLLVHL